MINCLNQVFTQIGRLTPKSPLTRLSIFPCLFALLTVQHGGLAAADITTNLSKRETYVGLPTVLRVAINNAVEHSPPVFPDVPGLTIEQAGPPSQQSQITSINGRRSQRTSIIYSFLVTPNKEGVYTIPPIQITADGVKSLTEAVRVVATKSETGDLLFAEINGNQSSVYVGESLELTLKFWIRPYKNAEYQVALTEQQMWQCLSEQTEWGIFNERMSELTKNRRRPGGQLVLRKDSSNQEREYLLYEIKSTLYPDRAVAIDASETRVIFNYPVKLGRSRSPLDIFSNDDFFSGTPFGNSGFGSFGSRLSVTEARPLVADITVQPIEVLPIPEIGRPDTYFGAVGNYNIKADAIPDRVKAGDPITLTLTIQGDGSMDVLRAPELSLQNRLTRNFKVADQSIAGIVTGNKKTFTTSIRPLSPDVEEIPAIEYSFFDPDKEQFVTVASKPIQIKVEEAEVLALTPSTTTRKKQNTDKQTSQSESIAVGEPIELFDTDEALAMVTKDRFWSGKRLAGLTLPPCLLAAFYLYRNRKSLSNRLPANYLFRTHLGQSQSIEEVNLALESYLTQRLKRKSEPTKRSALIGAIRTSGHYRVAEQVERLFQTEAQGGSYDLSKVQSEASQIVSDLSISSSKRLTIKRGITAGSSVILFSILTITHGTSSIALADTSPLQDVPALSLNQQKKLLEEGCRQFTNGRQSESPEKASEHYAAASQAFETLLGIGIKNDQLYYNLAEVFRANGDQGEAVANYRLALNLRPSNSLYSERLHSLEMEIKRSESEEELAGKIEGIPWDHSDPTSLIQSILKDNFWVYWCILWAAMTIGMIKRIPWMRVILTYVAIHCGISGYLYAKQIREFQNEDAAILIEPTVQLKAGNGEEFETIHTASDSEGKIVNRIEDRGKWMLVQFEADLQGWIHADSVITISE